MEQPQKSGPVLSKVSGDNPEDVFVRSVGSIIFKEKASNGYELERPQGLNNDPKLTSSINTNTSCIWFRKSPVTRHI